MSDLAMTVYGGHTWPGAGVVQWTRFYADNHYWYIETDGAIRSFSNHFALEHQGSKI